MVEEFEIEGIELIIVEKDDNSFVIYLNNEVIAVGKTIKQCFKNLISNPAFDEIFNWA